MARVSNEASNFLARVAIIPSSHMPSQTKQDVGIEKNRCHRICSQSNMRNERYPRIHLPHLPHHHHRLSCVEPRPPWCLWVGHDSRTYGQRSDAPIRLVIQPTAQPLSSAPPVKNELPGHASAGTHAVGGVSV